MFLRQYCGYVSKRKYDVKRCEKTKHNNTMYQ